jgi:hypothetical protein
MITNSKHTIIYDPAPEAKWTLWYQDLFDRECPRQVEMQGWGILQGLVELWTRHLFESVSVDGEKGFSRFNLWWENEKKSITINGDWQGMQRLRKWVFGNKRTLRKGYLQDSDTELIQKIARIHGCLILDGQNSKPILTLVTNSENRDDFESHLFDLEKFNQDETSADESDL